MFTKIAAPPAPPEKAEVVSDEAALRLAITSEDPPVILRNLLEHVSKFRVSDLFLCADESGLAVAARHLGLWRRIAHLPQEVGRRCQAYIKTSAGMDVTERRRPLDGRWMYRREDETVVDLRVNTIPTLHGEDCTLRLLDRSVGLLQIPQLGLLPGDAGRLLHMLGSPSGLILVTGPTGSGKTTTLYACLNHLNNGLRKINTIEDPIEYALLGVRQSQVNPGVELGFAELLRGVLRQAPDVIMVGEIRDAETAVTAVRAANSGHLVLATLHSPTAADAATALLHYGIHPYHLASCLLGAVAQRLVRTLNPKTKQPYDMSLAAGMFDEVKHLLEPGQQGLIYGPAHDATREEPAYTDRRGVFEVMAMTRPLRRLMVAGASAVEIRDKAVQEGMVGMRQAALLALARGQTSVEEVFRAIPAELMEAA